MNTNNQIKTNCKLILEILQSVNESIWSDVFQYFIAQFEVTEMKKLSREMLGIYTGMGSFNDLVLYKNGQLCYTENEDLNILRSVLFDELKKQL